MRLSFLSRLVAVAACFLLVLAAEEDCPEGCVKDKCYKAVYCKDKKKGEERCSEYLVLTVTPQSETKTVTKTVFLEPVATRYRRADGGDEDDGDEGNGDGDEVYSPEITEVPKYASNQCPDVDDYVSACSCIGVTPSVKTLETSTATKTTTVTIDPPQPPAPTSLRVVLIADRGPDDDEEDRKKVGKCRGQNCETYQNIYGYTRDVGFNRYLVDFTSDRKEATYFRTSDDGTLYALDGPAFTFYGYYDVANDNSSEVSFIESGLAQQEEYKPMKCRIEGDEKFLCRFSDETADFWMCFTDLWITRPGYDLRQDCDDAFKLRGIKARSVFRMHSDDYQID